MDEAGWRWVHVLIIPIYLMTLNRVKLGSAVTSIKYLNIVVCLIFLRKTLIWNEITLWLSNLLKLT